MNTFHSDLENNPNTVYNTFNWSVQKEHKYIFIYKQNLQISISRKKFITLKLHYFKYTIYNICSLNRFVAHLGQVCTHVRLDIKVKAGLIVTITASCQDIQELSFFKTRNYRKFGTLQENILTYEACSWLLTKRYQKMNFTSIRVSYYF